MLSALIPIFAQVTSLEFTDRSELALRVQGQDTEWDASTLPTLALRVQERRTSYSLTYTPSISALALGEPQFEVVVFHAADLSAELRFRRTSILLSQSAGYGKRNFRFASAPTVTSTAPGDMPDPSAPTPPTEPTVGQVGAADQVVTFGSLSSLISANHRVSRRVALSEYARYSVSGGLDEVSRRAYPQQNAVEAGPIVSVAVSRRDTLTTTATGSYVETDPDVRAWLASLSETWGRQMTRELQLGFGVGATFSRVENSAGVVDNFSLAPTGALIINYAWSDQGTQYLASLTAGTSPVVDRFTGLTDTRLVWNVLLSRTRAPLTLYAATTGANSIDSQGPGQLTSYGASLGAELAITPEFSLTSGVDGSVQAIGQADATPLLWGAFVGFSYRPQPIRF